MSIVDHVVASLYQVGETPAVDLLVNPADAQTTQDMVERRNLGSRFKVIQSSAIALGHMVVVDKLGVLSGLDLR